MHMFIKILQKTAIFGGISAVIYCGIAAVLIITGTTKKPAATKKTISFNELKFDYCDLPELKTYKARDGRSLGYRYYPSKSDTVLVLLHGSGWHSRYFLPLARHISTQNVAHVYTPDLRGHGPSPYHRGDIEYIGQLEDDIADLITLIRKDQTIRKIILGGHSSGGGLAIRYAGSPYAKDIQAYVLLAPYLKHDAPTTRQQSGGWAQANIKRIIGLSMFNNFGIDCFNGLQVLSFNMPPEVRDGTETLEYSFRLMVSYEPRDYKKDLEAITRPLLVIAGTEDESFFSSQYKPVISQYTEVDVREIQGATHMGVVTGPEVRGIIQKWLLSLSSSLQ